MKLITRTSFQEGIFHQLVTRINSAHGVRNLAELEKHALSIEALKSYIQGEIGRFFGPDFVSFFRKEGSGSSFSSLRGEALKTDRAFYYPAKDTREIFVSGNGDTSNEVFSAQPTDFPAVNTADFGRFESVIAIPLSTATGAMFGVVVVAKNEANSFEPAVVLPVLRLTLDDMALTMARKHLQF